MLGFHPRESGPEQSQASFLSSSNASSLNVLSETSLREIRDTAILLLSRRDYSRYELASKLRERYGVAALPHLNDVLDELQRNGLQSDQRFVEMVLQARRARGSGPLRIAQELKQKGVSAAEYEAALDANGESWKELARSVRCKKFGARLPLGLEEKAKQQRFLQYRGFSSDQIRAAFS